MSQPTPWCGAACRRSSARSWSDGRRADRRQPRDPQREFNSRPPLANGLFILVGIVAVLGIVTLQKEVAGAAEASIAYTLAAIKDWTFWLGPGWVVGWGNGLILGYLMYSSGLVPQKMAVLGLVGGPLIIVSGTLVMFGVADPGGPLQGIATIPEALWELLLGIYCTVKGFRPSSPILQADADRMKPMPAATPA
jgi:Domain of unknown function (DUF4386)